MQETIHGERKRKWRPQFQLKTLFLAITLIGIGIVLAERWHQHYAEEAAYEELVEALKKEPYDQYGGLP